MGRPVVQEQDRFVKMYHSKPQVLVQQHFVFKIHLRTYVE